MSGNDNLVDVMIKIMRNIPQDFKQKNDPFYFIKLLENHNRQKIISELIKSNTPLSIQSLRDRVGITYKNIHEHIKKLVQADILIRQKMEKEERGRPVKISLNPKIKKLLKSL